MTTKTFDCVAMKRKAQGEITAEWESRKEKFKSYGHFLEASLMESEWGRLTLERLRPSVPVER
ncbi:MAG: hypothetical protein WCJ35_19375 [Planctomycetota bacterium]